MSHANYISIKVKDGVSVTEDKDGLWKCSRLKKSKETGQPSAIPDPRLDRILDGKML